MDAVDDKKADDIDRRKKRRTRALLKHARALISNRTTDEGRFCASWAVALATMIAEEDRLGDVELLGQLRGFMKEVREFDKARADTVMEELLNREDAKERDRADAASVLRMPGKRAGR